MGIENNATAGAFMGLLVSSSSTPDLRPHDSYNQM